MAVETADDLKGRFFPVAVAGLAMGGSRPISSTTE